MGLLMRVSLISTLSLTKEVGLAAVSFMRMVIRLKRKSGHLYTALYLKQCGVCLQRYYAGCASKGSPLSVPVSLSRSGIPRVIPSVLRKVISRRDSHADTLVRLYLSWFGLAKLIAVAPRVRRSTFSSIVTQILILVQSWRCWEILKTSFATLQPLYLPNLSSIPLTKGMVWEPTWKSVPIQDSLLLRLGFKVDEKIDAARNRYVRFQNLFVNLKHEIAAFIYNINKIHSIPDGFFSPGILWYPRVLYPLDRKYTSESAIIDLDFFERCVGPQFATVSGAYQGFPMASGRLAQVIEGSGKRRIFAICNYIKQRLLYPVHSWAMSVLSSIPMDGTFNQVAPLLHLRSKRKDIVSSFDLKSATDRFPLSVIYTTFEMIWGSVFASAVVNSALGLNTFLVGKPLTSKLSELAFVCGQPLGFYGSWSLFALSHHYIVWLAAWKGELRFESTFQPTISMRLFYVG